MEDLLIKPIKQQSDQNICSLVEIADWSSLCIVCVQSGQHSLRLVIGSLCERLTSHVILALPNRHTAMPYNNKRPHTKSTN